MLPRPKANYKPSSKYYYTLMFVVRMRNCRNRTRSNAMMADRTSHKVSSNAAKLPALSAAKKRNRDSLVSQSSSSRSARLPPACPSPAPANLSRREYNRRRSSVINYGLSSKYNVKSSNDPRGALESPSPQIRSTEGREASPLQRFKTLANKVKNQIVWTKGLQRAEEHLKMTVIPGEDGMHGETLTFNVNAFKPEIQSWEGLSPKAKAILVKPSWLRTEDELKFLHRFTIRLKCFDRYPMYVRKELARVLYYESFDKGRVVIRQGDIGFNFYFILSGSVFVEMQEKDQRTGKKLNMIVGELSSGAAFGELALLHDDRRRATIVCKEYSEFLKVDKPDFDEVLKKNYEKEWKERMEYFKKHPLFEGWSHANLHYAVESSQTVEYLPGTVILKDLATPSENIFFIVKGTCKVVQKVYFWECNKQQYPKFTQDAFKLPPLSIGMRNQNETNTPAQFLRQVKKWWVLRMLQPGDYFGVGEGDIGVSVISHEKAEVLLINKMVFMKCGGGGKCLVRMRSEAEKLYPSRKVALQSFNETRRWKEYKKQMVMEIVERCKSATATCHSGPRSLVLRD